MSAVSVSRTMWEAAERFHGVSYLAPETREEADAIGLKGSMMAYFASRVAPAGPVPPAVVSSTFFYFGPARVNRAIPDAWAFASPTDVVSARYRGVDRALRRLLGDRVDSAETREAARLVREAAGQCEAIGRMLFAAWGSIDWPTEPHLALWHGCTLLREFRSGNHLIAVCAEGLDGCEAVVSHVAAGEAPREWIRAEAGWTEDEEEAAVGRLRARGWLDDAGRATDVCFAGRAAIEAMTDRLDQPTWDRVGATDGQRLFDLLADLTSDFPRDDQLDWREVYGAEGGTGGP